jgi:Type IV secretion system pilin
MNLIPVALAASNDYAVSIVNKVKVVIIYPLVTLMFIVAMVVFLWGVFEYVKDGTEESARATGKRHMIFGVIGFVVMLSAVAIFNIALGTLGLGRV